MRINSRVVVDIESGKIIERESGEHAGPVAFAWGGGSETTVNAGNSVVWAQRPEEQGAFDLFGGIIEQMLQDQGYNLKKTSKLDNVNPQLQAQIADSTSRLAAIDAQLAGLSPSDPSAIALQQEKAMLSEQLPELQRQYESEVSDLRSEIRRGKASKFDLSLEQRPLTEEQQKERDLESKLQDYYAGVLGGDMNDVPPAVKGYIDQIYADQDRTAKANLMQMGVEMAGSRGMNLSDTPIAQPLLQQYGDVQSQLGAARAQSYLGERSNEIARAQAFREFQANLNQLRNFTVPNAMAGLVSNVGLGLYQPRFRGGVGATTPAGNSTAATLAGISGTLGGLSNLANVRVNQAGSTLGSTIYSGIAGLFGGNSGGGGG